MSSNEGNKWKTDNLEESIDPTSELHLIEQHRLNVLVRDLILSKQQAKLLDHRLQEWNFLTRDVYVTTLKKE